MAPDPEVVIALAEKIKRVKLELTSLQHEWEALFGAQPDKSTVVRRKRDGSFAARVIQVLEAEPGRTFSISEVAKVLGVDDNLKVGRTLFRLGDTDKIDNVDRGLYRSKGKVEAIAA